MVGVWQRPKYMDKNIQQPHTYILSIRLEEKKTLFLPWSFNRNHFTSTMEQMIRVLSYVINAESCLNYHICNEHTIIGIGR